jgi:hypothetical protein
MLMNCNNNYAKEIKNGADGTLVITSKKKCWFMRNIYYTCNY